MEGVKDAKQETYDKLGKTIANEFRTAIASNPEQFAGQATEKTWQAFGDVYANIFKEIAENYPTISHLEQPLSTLRSAVFTLITAAVVFFATVGLNFTVYENYAPLTFVAG